MAVGDRATVGIELAWVDRMLLKPGQRHASERLVHLEQVDLVEAQAGALSACA